MKIKPSYIIIVVLVVLLVVSNLLGRGKVETKTEFITDTIIITHTDTFTQVKPKPIQTIIRDTIVAYSPNSDTIKLYYESKHYSEKDKYDAYISGYNANLDSISTYNKTEYKTITNTITNTIYKEKWNLYGKVGLDIINKQYSPNVGVILTMPNNFGFELNIGLYENKPIYGGAIIYKLK